MRRLPLFLVGISLLAAGAARAQGRRPPLPSEALTAVADGRAVRGVIAVQVEGAPCLSLRDIQRLTGARAVWRQQARQVSLVRESRAVDFTLDASTAVVDGKAVPLDVPVRWWTGQPYVPMTFLLSSAFRQFAAAEIAWDPRQRILAVTPLPDVSSPRFTASPGRTRVSFQVAEHVDYRVLQEREGALVLRFFGGRAGPRERLEVQDPLITAVDILPRRHATDALFTFSPQAARATVALEASPRRVTVEVRRLGAAPPAEEPPAADAPGAPAPLDDVPTLLPVPAPEVAVPVDPKTAAPAPKAPTALEALSPVRVIVIDPGHGGHDVGAVGRRGTREKDVNLAISKALARALKEEGRYEVHMTRTDDTFISLQDRAEFANKRDADLFISVHCNAALTAKSTGFEVYFLSENATDDAAAAVARRENASLELEGPADKVQAKVAQLLWSLAKTEDLNESSEVAALVHERAADSLGVPARGVKQAGFYVLKWARMPAILVESAFITNPSEERLLRNARYIDKIVDAVVDGVQGYERRKVQARLGKHTAGGGS